VANGKRKQPMIKVDNNFDFEFLSVEINNFIE
jgi:hypothetical protein